MLTISNAISRASTTPLNNPQSVSGILDQVQTHIPSSVERVSPSSECLARQSGSADVRHYGQELAYSKQRPRSFFSKCKITGDGAKLCELQKGDGACKVIKETVCNQPSAIVGKSIESIKEDCNKVRSICGD